MKNHIRKFVLLLVLAASVLGLAYVLVLYAGRQVDGLEAVFAIQMAMLSMLWFGFHLGEAADDWPLSIRPAGQSVTGGRERNGDYWTLSDQKAA